MELPDFLAKTTVDDYPKMAFISNLLSEESCGIIVKRVAFFDDHLLKEVLLAYRPRPDRIAKFSEGQVERLATFDKKITALADLALDTEAAKLRDLAVEKMTPMRKIRNKAAHVTKLASAEAEALWADEDNHQLMPNFPVNFNAQCDAVQDALQRLMANPDFTDAK